MRTLGGPLRCPQDVSQLRPLPGPSLGMVARPAAHRMWRSRGGGARTRGPCWTTFVPVRSWPILLVRCLVQVGAFDVVSQRLSSERHESAGGSLEGRTGSSRKLHSCGLAAPRGRCCSPPSISLRPGPLPAECVAAVGFPAEIRDPIPRRPLAPTSVTRFPGEIRDPIPRRPLAPTAVTRFPAEIRDPIPCRPLGPPREASGSLAPGSSGTGRRAEDPAFAGPADAPFAAEARSGEGACAGRSRCVVAGAGGELSRAG